MIYIIYYIKRNKSSDFDGYLWEMTVFVLYVERSLEIYKNI